MVGPVEGIGGRVFLGGLRFGSVFSKKIGPKKTEIFSKFKPLFNPRTLPFKKIEPLNHPHTPSFSPIFDYSTRGWSGRD